MKVLWIRPNHDDEGHRLVSLALCATNLNILVDEQILVHFSPDSTGDEIRTEARETWGCTDVRWGEIL